MLEKLPPFNLIHFSGNDEDSGIECELKCVGDNDPFSVEI